MKKRLCLIVFTFWVSSLTILYFKGKSDVENKLVQSLIINERSIGQLFDIAIAYNTSIAGQMESNLNAIGSHKYRHPLINELKDFPEIQSYGLDGSEKVNNQPYNANLTGIGSLQDVEIKIIDEMSAALSLNLSTPLTGENHDFTWSYYTSKSGFVLLAPSVSINDFHLSEYYYGNPFWSIATPDYNPEKETVISDLYVDAGGKGLMISISTPVYNNQTFKGVVSLDVGVHYLKGVLSSRNLSLNEHLFLISKEGRIAANTNETSLGDSLIEIKPSVFNHYSLFQYANKYYIKSKLVNNKFYSIYELTLMEINYLIVKETYNHALIVSLFTLICGLLVHLFNSLAYNKKLAQYDSLSQLYNRRTLEHLSRHEIKLSLKEKTSLSVLMIDIDNFKKLNDKYGHHIGDIGIKHVATIMSQSVRKIDIVGRYGGEEFVVVLPKTSIEQAVIIAEKIRKSIAQSTFSDKHHVTVSIGLTECIASKKTTTFNDLCQQADLALYKAKGDGRNRSVCYHLVDEKYNKRLN
ncbi:MAG: diguanylate cyclase (GGDEF)-like protein [Colwellia sp.]|jgi:diguanylate cyclase (GGDEF)-like protein